MSETKKQQLTKTLLELDREDQAWVINLLVSNLAGISTPTRRKARKPNRDVVSDEQWEAYFADKHETELPKDTSSLSAVLKATSGKTIKPLEKWL